jgi:O-succinylbenzoate synthase
MLQAKTQKLTLQFKRPSGTSRGVLTTKESWLLIIWDDATPAIKGIGECALLKGLSIDDRPDYEEKLKDVCANINNYEHLLDDELQIYPSIHFGLEMALKDLAAKGSKELFPSSFTQGTDSIQINGLIWMGEADFMRQQIREKLELGFSCIKLKIGAIDFEKELELLRSIRQEFSSDVIELRVDANGAFAPENALEKLKRLSEFELHSIEQPIATRQWEELAQLCQKTPLPIALDEELIGIFTATDKTQLLSTIQPQYIILKPSLIGGFKGSTEWIEIAEEHSIPWWVTSALESNIGLSAIAQWTYTLDNHMPQGLGTGQLYTNNIPCPLKLSGDQLYYSEENEWELPAFTIN